MRAFRIPCFVLLVLLALSLANSAAMTRHCREWTEALDAAHQAVAQKRWAEADKRLTQLEESWRACEVWLRITLSHNTVDDVEKLLDRAHLMIGLQESTHIHDSMTELRGLLDRIEGGERLGLANVL